jgi:hypothetical protein
VAARLHEAVEAGVLDLPEFDERVRDELSRLVADLPEPASPSPPIGVPARKRSLRAIRVTPLIGALATIPAVGGAVVLGSLGFTVLAILAATAADEESALEAEYRFPAGRRRGSTWIRPSGRRSNCTHGPDGGPA